MNDQQIHVISEKLKAAMGLLNEIHALVIDGYTSESKASVVKAEPPTAMAVVVPPMQTVPTVAPLVSPGILPSAPPQASVPMSSGGIPNQIKPLADCVFHLMTMVHQFYQMSGNVIMANQANAYFDRMKKSLTDAGYIEPPKLE